MEAEKTGTRVRTEKASGERSASGSPALGSPVPGVRLQSRRLDGRLGLGAGWREAVTNAEMHETAGVGGQKSARCGHGRAPSDGPGASPSPWQLPGTLCSLPVRGTPPPLSRVARASPWVAGGGVLTRILPVGARD